MATPFTYLELQNEILLNTDTGTAAIDAKIPGFINEAILKISKEDAVILPDLKTIVAVNTVTDQDYTALPQGYDRQIRRAAVAGVPISYYNTVEDLFDADSTMEEEGALEAVALEGTILWYHKTPADVTAITLMLYAEPTALAADGDQCTEIPAHIQRDTIIPLASKWCFDLVEQGEEDVTVNSRVERIKYEKGIKKLVTYIAARRRNIATSIWNV